MVYSSRTQRSAPPIQAHAGLKTARGNAALSFICALEASSGTTNRETRLTEKRLSRTLHVPMPWQLHALSRLRAGRAAASTGGEPPWREPGAAAGGVTAAWQRGRPIARSSRAGTCCAACRAELPPSGPPSA
eukprot:scaffold12045_cov109-Isochrysis_galbana.AAC.1